MFYEKTHSDDVSTTSYDVRYAANAVAEDFVAFHEAAVIRVQAGFETSLECIVVARFCC